MIQRFSIVRSVLTLSSLTLTLVGIAWAETPKVQDLTCLEGKKELSVDNRQVLSWQTSTPVNFLKRARIEGELILVFPDRNSHEHLFVQIGKDFTESIEIIYNKAFGELRHVQIGARVQACGDYITTGGFERKEKEVKQDMEDPVLSKGSYTPSILHWVHESTDTQKHASGFLVIGDEVFGYEGSGHR